jgi:hypothetical protein
VSDADDDASVDAFAGTTAYSAPDVPPERHTRVPVIDGVTDPIPGSVVPDEHDASIGGAAVNVNVVESDVPETDAVI